MSIYGDIIMRHLQGMPDGWLEHTWTDGEIDRLNAGMPQIQDDAREHGAIGHALGASVAEYIDKAIAQAIIEAGNNAATTVLFPPSDRLTHE